jgi:lipopolysaccharide transport system permease protein
MTQTSVQHEFQAAHRANGSRPTVIIEPGRGLFNLDLAAVWQYRELLYFLVWRDVKSRYRQTVLGAAWAILQPFATMVILTMVFGHFARVPSDGIPYPIFAYAALLPWTYFAQAVGRSGISVVSEANLIRKVYFPRLILPMTSVTTPLVDLAVSFPILIGLMLWFGVPVTLRVLALPALVLLAFAAALAVSLWLSALNVRYRDVGHTIPFLVQIWMYGSPVAYPLSLVPEDLRLLYSLNPLVSVIEGFRWALAGGPGVQPSQLLASITVVAVVLASGVLFFRRLEPAFADVV